MTGRSFPRTIRRELRRSGCTCRPTVDVLPKVIVEAKKGATDGALVRHETGCVLGDAVAAENRVGIIPETIYHGSRCDR